MKYVPKAVTRAVGTSMLKAQRNSPTLLFVAGVAGFGATIFLACKATLKVDDILTNHEKDMLEVQRVYSRPGILLDAQPEERKIMLKTTIELGKVYAPALICGVVSVACLTKSHRILSERNATLTMAYVGLQKFLEEYRGRVREKIGKEEERNVYYAATPVELVQDTDKGPKKIFGSAPGQKSPYSAIFDETNGNWTGSHEYNVNFLRIQQQLLTDKLRTQGSLMLNEVYDRLGMPRTPNGALVGWKIGYPDSDDFVEFDIIPVHDFHGTLMVDFNVAGVVYHMLSGRAEIPGRSRT